MTGVDVNADENTRLVRDSAAAIAPRDGDLRRVRALRFERPGYDPEMWRRMADLGWLGLRVPEEAGGSGLGMATFCALAEELGAGLVPEPLIACAPAFRLLPDDVRGEALAGRCLVVPAWQEAPGGIEPSGAATFAGGRVSGTKLFVPFAGAADRFLVSTRDGLALVGREAEGVSVEDVGTQDGGRLGRLTFMGTEAVPVPGDFGTILDEITLAGAAYLLGAMDAAFAMTLGYLATRKQFGRAIGSFQALQHRAVDLKVQIELTRAVVAEAALSLDRNADPHARRAVVSRAKARASDTAMLVARETVQFHGAMGVTDEHDIGLYSRKMLTLASMYGSARAHRARYLAMARSGTNGDAR